MKTGRLLKFPRAGADLHAYLYQDGPEVKAAVYHLGPGSQGIDPIHTVTGASAAVVEADVRSWVEDHFPKTMAPKDSSR
jgi:hypothetical protein